MNIINKVDRHIEKVEFDHPVVITVNEFTEKSVLSFSESMSKAQNTGQNVVPVVIDSFGGAVYSLLAMISIIKQSNIPVATIVESKAMSCGAVLLTCGDPGLRFVDRDATVLIHDVSAWAQGKVEEMKSDIKQATMLNKKIYNIMDRNCGHKTGYFMGIVDEKKHADWYLNSRELLRHGIADTTSIPSLCCSVSLNIDIQRGTK